MLYNIYYTRNGELIDVTQVDEVYNMDGEIDKEFLEGLASRFGIQPPFDVEIEPLDFFDEDDY